MLSPSDLSDSVSNFTTNSYRTPKIKKIPTQTFICITRQSSVCFGLSGNHKLATSYKVVAYAWSCINETTSSGIALWPIYKEGYAGQLRASVSNCTSSLIVQEQARIVLKPLQQLSLTNPSSVTGMIYSSIRTIVYVYKLKMFKFVCSSFLHLQINPHKQPKLFNEQTCDLRSHDVFH